MVDEDVLSRSFCAVGGGVLACVLKALENNKKRRSHYEMMTLVENEKITMHNDGRFIITSFAAAGIERGGDYCAQNSTNETRTMANCIAQLSIVCVVLFL